MDRQAANKALAKAIAYVECGKPDQAAEWLTTLTEMFSEVGVVPVIEPRTSQVAYDRHAERIERQDAEDIRERQRDMRAASAWLGGRLLGREGSVQL